MHVNHRLIQGITSALLVGTLAITQVITGYAASISPSASQLSQSKTYYRRHANQLAQRYHLNYAAQTALTCNETTKVYVASQDAQLKKSAKLAMIYWNKKLGRQTFRTGTKAHHNLTIIVTNRETNVDAWWRPAQRQITLESKDYHAKTGRIRAKMRNRIAETAVNQANKKIRAYAHKIKGQPNYVHRYNVYRTAQIKKAQRQITTQQRQVTTQKLDVKARTFKYANTIAHEMGHSLGLLHSPNTHDAMFKTSTTPQIYNFSQVKRSKTGFNPLTRADTNRAKLALKVHAAH